MSLKLFLKIFGFLAILLTIIPIFGANYWWIRVFDFPHLQLTLFTLIAILVYMIRFDTTEGFDLAFTVILLLCFAFQISKIYPYTELAPHEVFTTSEDKPSKDFKIYVANVLQSNQSYDLVNKAIEHYDTDFLLFLETDIAWQRAIVSSLDESYKYRVEMPLNNTYGMLMYSKQELIDPQVKYLVSDSIPSIHTKMVLTSGDTIQIYAIHPTPPMPTHNPMSTDRDAEMMKIAFLARSSELPVIVMGDFNDVAWSGTTKLFEETSQLLDLRKGRGLYNTFSAKNILMRWPLDHIFISSDFRLVSMERGDKIGSDHFPFYTHVNLEKEYASDQAPDPIAPDRLAKAQKIATRVQN